MRVSARIIVKDDIIRNTRKGHLCRCIDALSVGVSDRGTQKQVWYFVSFELPDQLRTIKRAINSKNGLIIKNSNAIVRDFILKSIQNLPADVCILCTIIISTVVGQVSEFGMYAEIFYGSMSAFSPIYCPDNVEICRG